jgi:hypothetical protein
MMYASGMPSDAFVIDPSKVRDLRSQALDSTGRLRILPAAFWQSTTKLERAAFGARTGIYSFPTLELVERLRELIDGRTAIEIGAGNGVLAEALGIPATDNFQQRIPRYRSHYEALGIATVPYGSKVIDMDASSAVQHFKPAVVIGCWVTHRFNPLEPDRGGNEIGVDEPDLVRHCEAYVFVGNERVHQEKPLWARAHSIEYPTYVFSRASNESRDFIAVFRGDLEKPVMSCCK